MEASLRQAIRDRVLHYLEHQAVPVGLTAIATNVRAQNDLTRLRDSDILNVVQSMIVTGKLNYSSGLKIELRRTAAV